VGEASVVSPVKFTKFTHSTSCQAVIAMIICPSVFRNCAWNPLTALTDLDTTTYLRSSPFSEPIARRLIREVVAVARGLGMELDVGDKSREDTIIELVYQAPLTSSMRSDTHNHRAMEVEAILGYPLTCAKSLGVDTPVLETLYVLMSAIDARFAGRIQALV